MHNHLQACDCDVISQMQTSPPHSEAIDACRGAMTGLDVWTHMIRLLEGSRDPRRIHLANDSTRPSSLRPCAAQSHNARIEVVERLTDRTVVILWQDATRCRYVDQVWTCGRARRAGQCAITGVAISRDDMVYKPRSKSGFRGNAGAMILASVIADMPPTS